MRVLPLNFHSSVSLSSRFISSLASRLPSQKRSCSTGRGGIRRLMLDSGTVCVLPLTTRTMPLPAASSWLLCSLSRPCRRISKGFSERRVSISFQAISTWPAYLVFKASLPPSSRTISPLKRSPLFNHTVSAHAGAARAKTREHNRVRSSMMGKPDSEPKQGSKHAAPGQPTASQVERRTALYAVLAQIPAGCVVSYGQLAAYAGLGRAARWVGRTLSQLPDGSILPWHRVIAAGGLPYMLVFSTLSVWLREAGVARDTIGFASLIGLAYAFKWVWSPLLDQWRLPLLGRLGRRRSWLLLSQGLIALGLIGMAFCDPQQHLHWLIAIAVVVTFASATQDIAVDAYRLEIADDTHQDRKSV